MQLFAQPERSAAIDALHSATAIYTAEPVVDELLDHIDWPRGDCRLVDPSCGDGIFLGRALDRLLAAEPCAGADRLVHLLEGWEIHPHAAHEARSRIARILTAHRWPAAAAEDGARRIVRNADFLTEGPATGRRYHAIAGNPPYLRFTNVPDLLRQEYQAVTPDYARADLLHSFLDRCAKLLEPDGVVAMVTADRWLFNLSAAGLRIALGQSLCIRHLERLDPSTAFYRPKHRVKGSPPRIHPVAVVLGAPTAGCITLDGAAIHPDAANDAEAPAARTLADVATVRQGPWLGAPGIFVVDAETAKRLPPECLVPAIGPRDLVNGEVGPIRRWAIRTTAAEPPAEVLAHLDANLDRMARRGRRNPRWLPPESWGELPFDRPSLLIPRIAKTLRPVRLPPGVLPTNHDVSIVAAGDTPLDAIEAALSSDCAQEWMRARAARLESGYHSITTTLLRQFPME